MRRATPQLRIVTSTDLGVHAVATAISTFDSANQTGELDVVFASTPQTTLTLCTWLILRKQLNPRTSEQSNFMHTLPA
jgi:hypothetical protein